VELTRKRQGQNIYELFGRACPSCGGLGHVVTLPGKDSLQPLAALPGLVRSVASARAEVSSPSGIDVGGRRRAGRGGTRSFDSEPTAASSGVPALTTATATATAPSEPRRNDPELLAVSMDDSQELVFGWMGLNPALLLDPPLEELENVVVKVVRPGEDAAQVLELARTELAAQGGRRRRGGRSAGRSSMVEITQADGDGFNNSEQEQEQEQEELFTIAPLLTIEPEFDEPFESEETNESEEINEVAVNKEAEVAIEIELDPADEGRRRRRRSSAS